jgi:hypothetical protein
MAATILHQATAPARDARGIAKLITMSARANSAPAANSAGTLKDRIQIARRQKTCNAVKLVRVFLKPAMAWIVLLLTIAFSKKKKSANAVFQQIKTFVNNTKEPVQLVRTS